MLSNFEQLFFYTYNHRSALVSEIFAYNECIMNIAYTYAFVAAGV